MGRLNLFLLTLVIFCAIVVVDQQHKTRTLFVALEREQQAEQQIDQVFMRLQLQQVALAKGERVDEVARTKLNMSTPPAEAVIFMALDGGFQHD